MKNKFRKITICNLIYLYNITNQFQPENSTNTLTLKVFLSGHKKTPLIIEFMTIDDCIRGQLLNSGINMKNTKTDTTEIVNINKPKYIRELILLGIKNGWTGFNKIDNQNGLSFLEELGFMTTDLSPGKSS